jgi:glutamyl-tRNA synthetase
MGYDPDCVCEYIMTLLNSNYEEWHAQNPEKPYTEFPFNIKKMSSSGCLFDFNKINDVSKNVISRMTAEQVYEKVLAWATAYDTEFASLLSADPAYTKRILAIGRGGKKPRKDFATWMDVKPYMGFFFDELFAREDAYPDRFETADIQAALTAFVQSYDPADDATVWFDKVKAIADQLGYASDMKAYKQNPEAFRGSVADISMFLRLAVTGKQNSPDMYESMQILGKDRVLARIEAARASL